MSIALDLFIEFEDVAPRSTMFTKWFRAHRFGPQCGKRPTYSWLLGHSRIMLSTSDITDDDLNRFPGVHGRDLTRSRFLMDFWLESRLSRHRDSVMSFAAQEPGARSLARHRTTRRSQFSNSTSHGRPQSTLSAPSPALLSLLEEILQVSVPPGGPASSISAFGQAIYGDEYFWATFDDPRASHLFSEIVFGESRQQIDSTEQHIFPISPMLVMTKPHIWLMCEERHYPPNAVYPESTTGPLSDGLSRLRLLDDYCSSAVGSGKHMRVNAASGRCVVTRDDAANAEKRVAGICKLPVDEAQKKRDISEYGVY
ncbi:hypothetical protein FISHEDRAFT_58632 [Fistulina hepatica ATCC 64428]|uniref:Uncharacterized protein n=1 Tax=Fistulina hepatica ATCC 64428 TaxID=1128425 RepID=A0A0D7AD16_9AGAR|nr:hypothetical protein FISHEDRAFT_58632 [Fistulina hepatica ATCC 64428]